MIRGTASVVGLSMGRAQLLKSITLRIGSRIAEITKVASAVDAFGAEYGLSRTILNDMSIVLDEILNNTITHGFVDDELHEIVVNLTLGRGELVAEVRDDGVPFNPLEVPPPDLSGGLQERRVGGIGLHFVRSLMDGVEYSREVGSNRLRLRKRLGVQEEPDGNR
jgi:serine/threonine-protein kinase RsbW